jgi:hypothetical protein
MLAVIAMARWTLACIAADSGVRRAMILVRSSFAIRHFPLPAGIWETLRRTRLHAPQGATFLSTARMAHLPSEACTTEFRRRPASRSVALAAQAYKNLSSAAGISLDVDQEPEPVLRTTLHS